METGKMINRISNRLRRRSLQIQTKLGISGAQGNVLDYILIESEKHSVYQKEIEPVSYTHLHRVLHLQH